LNTLQVKVPILITREPNCGLLAVVYSLEDLIIGVRDILVLGRECIEEEESG